MHVLRRISPRRWRWPLQLQQQARWISDDHWFTVDETAASQVTSLDDLLPSNSPRHRASGQADLEGGVLYRLPSVFVVIWHGDISKWHVPGQRDAIVAPANKKLNPGVGVNRVIHNAAGPSLADACAAHKSINDLGAKCQVGKAVVTKAYRLPVHRIIHAVGPAYDPMMDNSHLLESAYKHSLQQAAEYELGCIAFPPISCNVYGYPIVEGARIALRAIVRPPSCVKEVHFVLSDADDYVTWVIEANNILVQYL